jgi:hypothetical protein
MNVLRKAVISCLALLGAYYCVRGLTILMNLQQVTAQWVVASGDPDFRLDFGSFMVMIGAGAVAVVSLGLTTAIGSVRATIGRPPRTRFWVALALASVLIQIPWFLYRVINTGTMARADAARELRLVAWRFAGITMLYLLGLLAARYARPRTAERS